MINVKTPNVWFRFSDSKKLYKGNAWRDGYVFLVEINEVSPHIRQTGTYLPTIQMTANKQDFFDLKVSVLVLPPFYIEFATGLKQDVG